MSPNGRLWLVAIGAALAGALLGAGAVWATQQSEVALLNARIIRIEADRDASQRLAEEMSTALEDLQAASSAQVTPTEPSTPTTVAAPATPEPAKKPAGKSTKQFIFVSKVIDSGAKPVIVADYAQMLSGDAAAAAATKRGDESPPPNDYYIVNDNKQLRTLSVQPGIKVTLTTNDDGSADPSGRSVTFDKWAAMYSAPTDENENVRQAPYWITVKGGVVTKIAQQYLP